MNTEEIKITVDGNSCTVLRSHYVKAKTKQLREFGYANLTEKEVDAELAQLESEAQS